MQEAVDRAQRALAESRAAESAAAKASALADGHLDAADGQATISEQVLRMLDFLSFLCVKTRNMISVVISGTVESISSHPAFPGGSLIVQIRRTHHS